MTVGERFSFEVALPAGPLAVSAERTTGTNDATILLAHGAGAGMDHPFLLGLSQELTALGFSTVRFNFPYVEQERRMPGPAAHAISTWRAAVDAVRLQDQATTVWAAGKSYGGRMASMAVAEGLQVAGLVYIGYPLHPPGAPEKLRADHLPAISVPQLFIEGSNDPFIQPLDQFETVLDTCQDAQVAWIDGGGHSFEVKGQKCPASEVGASLAPLIAAYVTR